MPKKDLTSNVRDVDEFFTGSDEAGGVTAPGTSHAPRPSLTPAADEGAAGNDRATQEALARAVRSMRWSQFWNKYGAGLICLNDIVSKNQLSRAFGVVAGTMLGHGFCLAQLGAAVYGGFSVTNPLYYMVPPGLALAAKVGVDRFKPANGEVEKQQRRNFLRYAVGSSVLAVAWGMRGHLGFDPGGSYGLEFSKLNPAQQSYLEGEIGLYYFPQLKESERQKILKDAAYAGKTPVAYVFDRDGVVIIMEACNRNKPRVTASPIVQSRLEHSLPLN